MAGNHHRDPQYVRASRQIRAAANANPTTRCWRCGRTLDEHPYHRSGARPIWHAGHTVDGDNSAPLAAEASTCNIIAGNIARQVRAAGGYDWP